MAMPQAPAPAAPMAPGLANVFYAGAVKFAGDKGKEQGMADVADFQGRMAQARESMELALEGKAGENETQDAYERLMSVADDPAVTINDLMKIIEGG